MFQTWKVFPTYLISVFSLFCHEIGKVGNTVTIVNYSASSKVRLFFIACSWQQLDRPFVENTYISFDVRIVSSKVYATYCWIRNGIQIKCILQEKYFCSMVEKTNIYSYWKNISWNQLHFRVFFCFLSLFPHCVT